MHSITLISLAFFAVTAIGGLLTVAVQGFAAWRALSRFRRNTSAALQQVAWRISIAEKRLASASGRGAELERARAQLHESLTTAAIVTSATGEAWDVYGRARGIVPRK